MFFYQLAAWWSKDLLTLFPHIASAAADVDVYFQNAECCDHCFPSPKIYLVFLLPPYILLVLWFCVYK